MDYRLQQIISQVDFRWMVRNHKAARPASGFYYEGPIANKFMPATSPVGYHSTVSLIDERYHRNLEKDFVIQTEIGESILIRYSYGYQLSHVVVIDKAPCMMWLDAGIAPIGNGLSWDNKQFKCEALIGVKDPIIVQVDVTFNGSRTNVSNKKNYRKLVRGENYYSTYIEFISTGYHRI